MKANPAAAADASPIVTDAAAGQAQGCAVPFQRRFSGSCDNRAGPRIRGGRPCAVVRGPDREAAMTCPWHVLRWLRRSSGRAGDRPGSWIPGGTRAAAPAAGL